MMLEIDKVFLDQLLPGWDEGTRVIYAETP